MLVLLLFLVIILIAISLIYVTNTAAKSQTQSSENYLGEEACDPVGKAEDGVEEYKCMAANATEWTIDYAKAQGGEILDCWCLTQGAQKVLEDDAIRSACSSWLTGVGTGAAIGMVSSFIVVIINVVMKKLLLALAEFEKPLSVSARNRSVMAKVALAQILNTGFVVVIVNYHAPQALQTLTAWSGGMLFKGPYDDFTRGWYSIVGSVLLNNLLVNSFQPALTGVAMMVVSILKRRAKRGKAVHQAELLDLYTQPPFDISARYAQLLTTVFCTLIYSSGMPVLYFFAAAYMFITYWADKVVLLWGSRRPPAYDTQMPYQASQIMLYAAALHCAFAIAMLGNPCTFPSNALGGSLGDISAQARSSNSTSSDSDVFYEWIGSRVSVESTWMLFSALLVLAGLWCVWTVLWVLGSTFGEFFKCLVLTLCPSRMQESTLWRQDTLDWNQASIHIQKACPPASYRLDQNPDLKHLAQYLRNTDTGVANAGGLDEANKQGFEQPAAIDVDKPATAGADPAEAQRGWTPASVSSADGNVGAVAELPPFPELNGAAAQPSAAPEVDAASAPAPTATTEQADAEQLVAEAVAED